MSACLIGLIALAPAPAAAVAARVTICHQVGNLSYVAITVDVNSIVNGGHAHHSGDIIPAFSARQGNRELHFAGRNLDQIRSDGLTGAHVIASGCATPPDVSQIAPPTSGQVAVPTTATTLSPTQTTQAVPTSTAPAVPTTGVQITTAPETTERGPEPTPVPTAVPTTGAQTTLVPETTERVPQPTPTLAPETTERVPQPTPTLAPETTERVPQPTPTLAPETTEPTTRDNCDDDELAHAGSCYPIPELVIPPTPQLPAVTQRPSTGSLIPTVECVDTRDDGIRVVWFGYDSTATSPLLVERGPANEITPRGLPPTLFGPGVHVFVLHVETTDGVASWTLAGETVTSGPDSPDCDEPTPVTSEPPATSTTATTEPGGTATTEPGGTATTEPGTTVTTEPGTTVTTEPGTTATTEPGTTATTEPGGTATTEPGNTPTTDAAVTTTSVPETNVPTPERCATSESHAEGDCVVEPLRLVLVDNVVECDGHGIARFAAFNDNVFALETEDVTSLVSPARLAEGAPQVIDERDVESDDGGSSVALFTVRYVTAVTWTVEHHGYEASVSAGVNGADVDPDCPTALLNSSGAPGLLDMESPLVTTGSDSSAPLSIVAVLLTGLGVVLLTIVRRRPATTS